MSNPFDKICDFAREILGLKLSETQKRVLTEMDNPVLPLTEFDDVYRYSTERGVFQNGELIFPYDGSIPDSNFSAAYMFDKENKNLKFLGYKKD